MIVVGSIASGVSGDNKESLDRGESSVSVDTKHLLTIMGNKRVAKAPAHQRLLHARGLLGWVWGARWDPSGCGGLYGTRGMVCRWGGGDCSMVGYGTRGWDPETGRQIGMCYRRV